jgi:hypothetical protein
MGLSVLEAANTGLKYLNSNRTPGCIDCVVLTHTPLTYILPPSPDLPGAFIPVHAL